MCQKLWAAFDMVQPPELGDLCRDVCETRAVQNGHGTEREVVFFPILRRQEGDGSFAGDVTQEYILWEGATRHCKALYLLIEDLPAPWPWPQSKSSGEKCALRMMRFLEATREICWAYSDWETTTQWIVPAWSQPQRWETNSCIPLLVSELYKERLKDFPPAAVGPWLAVWDTESAVGRVWKAAGAAYRDMASRPGSAWPSSSSSLSSVSQGLESWEDHAVQLDVGSMFPCTMVGSADSTERSEEAYSTALDLWRQIMDSECVTAEQGEQPTRRPVGAALLQDPD